MRLFKVKLFTIQQQQKTLVSSACVYNFIFLKKKNLLVTSDCKKML